MMIWCFVLFTGSLFPFDWKNGDNGLSVVWWCVMVKNILLYIMPLCLWVKKANQAIIVEQV